MKTEKPEGPPNTTIGNDAAQSCLLLGLTCMAGVLMLFFLWLAVN